MRDTYTNSIIKVHYIWFYNVNKLYILIVKSFIPTKTQVTHHFEKVSLFTGPDSHTRLVLQNTVTRNMEMCDLNSVISNMI